MAELIPNLQAQLAGFKERVKQDPTIRIEGGKGGGDVGWALALAMAAAAWFARRRHA